MGLFRKKLTPLTYKEVINGLTLMGFTMRPKTGTSHEKWFKETDKGRFSVTVDKPQAPFSRFLIISMAKQAGVDARKFHALCRGECTLKEAGLKPAE